jgi:hypothetical protein
MKLLAGALLLLIVAGVIRLHLATTESKKEEARDRALTLIKQAFAAAKAKDRDGFRESAHFTAEVEMLKIEGLHELLARNFPEELNLERCLNERSSGSEEPPQWLVSFGGGPSGQVRFSVTEDKIVSLDILLRPSLPREVSTTR